MAAHRRRRIFVLEQCEPKLLLSTVPPAEISPVSEAVMTISQVPAAVAAAQCEEPGPVAVNGMLEETDEATEDDDSLPTAKGIFSSGDPLPAAKGIFSSGDPLPTAMAK